MAAAYLHGGTSPRIAHTTRPLNVGDTTLKRSTWGYASFTVRTGEAAPFLLTIRGRDRWALESLMRAGAKGCTPICNPAPRWASYVHKLREDGVHIDTITEPHDGPFAGHHARYVLRSVVKPGNAA